MLNQVSQNQTPYTVAPGKTHPIEISFVPPMGTDTEAYYSWLRVYSSDGIEDSAGLYGEGVAVPASVAAAASQQVAIQLWSGNRCSYIPLANAWIAPIRLEVFNLLGISVYSTSDVLMSGANLLPSSLPPGVYMYRLSSSSGSEVGKLLLE